MEVLNLYRQLLDEFLQFKSISTDPKNSKTMMATADWLKKVFVSNGFNAELWKSESTNPIVFAEFSPVLTTHVSQPGTVLIYGHYDVQPASAEGWKGNPFSLTEDEERLYGRGVIDNKGQVLVHIAAVLNLIRQNKLNSNVKFMIEGNEETGNEDLANIMEKFRHKLKCDYVLVSDGELTNNKPTIEISLRGGFNCTLVYKSGANDLHSGMWGGAVPNAAHELSYFLSNLFDKMGSVNFKEFYQDLDALEKSQLENNRRLSKQAGNLKNLAGVKQMLFDKSFDFYTTTGLRPTIQVTGIKTGYIDSGYANIVPAKAEAKLNFRLAPSQQTKTIIKSFIDYVKSNTPKYIDYKLDFDHPHEPVKISTKNNAVVKITTLLEKVYKEKVNRRNVGGAIPFVADVKNILGVDAVLVPLVNEDCNMHGVNENFDKKYLLKALVFSDKLFSI